MAISASSFPFGDTPDGLEISLAALVFTAAIVGGGLPARALGLSWSRSLAAGLVGHLLAATLVLAIPWRPFDSLLTYLGLELCLSATGAALLWAGEARSRKSALLVGVSLLAACAALGGVSSGVFSLLVGPLSWVLLPAVVGLLESNRR